MRILDAAILLMACVALNPEIVSGNTEQGKTLRGWLSDEQCARGRAKGGVYTGTNPDCAKQCVAKGAKIVLVMPDEKQILNVANQAAAENNIGDYVEVNGKIDREAGTLRIESLKLITEGRAMCALPKPKK